MGTSPEGKLFYGYAWDDDEQPEDYDLVHKVMLERTMAELPAIDGEKAHELRRRAQLSLGIEWGLHGSEYQLNHYLAVTSTQKSAEWGELVGVNPDEMVSVLTAKVWDERLRGYLESAEIESPVKRPHPQWYLTSLYF